MIAEKLIKIITASSCVLFLGCSSFGANKVVSVNGDRLVVRISEIYGTMDGNFKWADTTAQGYCNSRGKIVSWYKDWDNSLFKEATYYCVTEEIYHKTLELSRGGGYEAVSLYYKGTYGFGNSQLERLSNAITEAQATPTPAPRGATNANSSSVNSMICLKHSEETSGVFKTCRYSCGGRIVSNTIRSTEFCESSRRF